MDVLFSWLALYVFWYGAPMTVIAMIVAGSINLWSRVAERQEK